MSNVEDEAPRIEEVDEEEDGPPPLEEAAAPGFGEGEQMEGGGKQSKSEKKTRKAVAKLGLKPVPNVTKVTIKKQKVCGRRCSCGFEGALTGLFL